VAVTAVVPIALKPNQVRTIDSASHADRWNNVTTSGEEIATLGKRLQIVVQGAGPWERASPENPGQNVLCCSALRAQPFALTHWRARVYTELSTGGPKWRCLCTVRPVVPAIAFVAARWAYGLGVATIDVIPLRWNRLNSQPCADVPTELAQDLTQDE
jgi:hypothetical protein